ncbi:MULTISPECIES: hypothetical protein [Streptomyces]|uniref:hypothetical protein n=1 Tax=Streptomyces TaxID=1883 RepID=UPI002257B8CD|nr:MULTISPECIES: hypothetical protein [Streptomyces]MCX5059006.1 hypothetical protein [Streptomyces sp. NBC_00452]MCZ4516695.1 hypothetical protein [Streptomyces sp. ActVer]
MTIPTEPASPEHRLHLSQLAIYLRESRQILAAWDSYSDQHSDPDTHQPYDEDAYGLRQRDSDTLVSFGWVYDHVDELVHVAEQQLAQLPTSVRTRRYAWQVRELRDSTKGLYAVHDDWLAVRRALPASARPGTEAFEERLAESYAEAWHYLDQWAIHGQALFAINALAQKRPKASAPALVTAPPVPKAAAASSAARRWCA